MEIFFKDFSGTTSPRILEFGTNINYDRLYCVLKNQPHMAYQSLYLFIFLSNNFFHLISLAFISATVFKLCIHNEDNQVYNCKKPEDHWSCKRSPDILTLVKHKTYKTWKIYMVKK